MGHKVHPYGFRIGVSRTWTAKWYADKEYTALLKEDIAIRELVTRRLANASVSQVEIERGINHVTVTVHTAKPGIVIGKGGQNVEILRTQIGALTNRKVKLEIKEIRQPELDAYLVAANVAQQLSRRIAFKKAMKQSIQRTMKAGAKGVRIAVAGRLGGSEMGRREWDREGRIPLGTLRADDLRELDARDAGHPHVRQQQVHLDALGAQEVQRFVARRRHGDGKAALRKIVLHNFPDHQLVLDDQRMGLHARCDCRIDTPLPAVSRRQIFSVVLLHQVCW